MLFLFLLYRETVPGHDIFESIRVTRILNGVIRMKSGFCLSDISNLIFGQFFLFRIKREYSVGVPSMASGKKFRLFNKETTYMKPRYPPNEALQLFKREGNDFTNEKTTGDINSNEMLRSGKYYARVFELLG